MYNSSEIAYNCFIVHFFVDLLHSVMKINTYGAVSMQMTSLDFDLSAIRLAGHGYVDVRCWCAHRRYDIMPPREVRKVIFSLRLRRPLRRHLRMTTTASGFSHYMIDVAGAVCVFWSARHAGSAVTAVSTKCLFQLRQLRRVRWSLDDCWQKSILLRWPICVEQSSCI